MSTGDTDNVIAWHMSSLVSKLPDCKKKMSYCHAFSFSMAIRLSMYTVENQF